VDVKDLLDKEDMVLKESVIYAIINIVDQKLYIGSAVQARRRKQEHLSRLRNGNHCNTHLQGAYNKYGEENFKFVVLNKVSNIKELDKYEQIWIDTFDFNKQLYNFCKVAGNTTGRVVTEETRKKISKKKKGRKMSDAAKKKMSIAQKGRKQTQEAIDKTATAKQKRCVKIDKDTKEIIEIFASFRKAANSLGLIKAGDLISCARGKLKTSHGFIWKYIDTEDLHLNKDYISKPRTSGAKKINTYDKTTNELFFTFYSATEATKGLKLDPRCIANICKAAVTKDKVAYGYKLEYA